MIANQKDKRLYVHALSCQLQLYQVKAKRNSIIRFVETLFTLRELENETPYLACI